MKTKAHGSKKYQKVLGHIGALMTVIAWGSSFICTKVLMDDGGFTPVETYVYRFALAYIFLLPFTFKKIFSNSWRDEIQLALCGICSGTLYFILENYALTMTSTGNVSLLSGISPIFTALLMAAVYKAALNKGIIVGSLIAIVGVACVILAPSIAQGLGMEINPAGDLLALSSALSWAIYSVAAKRLVPLYSTSFITRKMFFYGVLTALPILFLEPAPHHLAELFSLSQPTYLLNMLFLVLICSLMAYIFWNESMKKIGPVAANNYLYAQPIVTMVMAWIVFSEPVYPLGYLGCLLIVGGLVLADKWN